MKYRSVTDDCCNCYNCESNRSCYCYHNPFTFKFVILFVFSFQASLGLVFFF